MSTRSAGPRPLPPLGVCRYCFVTHNQVHKLASTDNRFMSCPACGTIDEKATSAHQTVNIHQIRGAQMDENQEIMTLGGTWSDRAGDAYNEWKERKFQEDLKHRLELYLADSEHCVIETPAPHLIAPVRAVFQRIRERERDHRNKLANDRLLERAKASANDPNSSEERRALNFRLANDNDAFRIPCQVISAIKFVVEDRNLLYVNRRVGRKTDKIPANVREDAEINSVPLNQIFHRLSNSNQKIKGDSFAYLKSIHRRTSNLLERGRNSTDEVMLCVLQVVKRLEFLLALKWEKRVKAFITRPLRSTKKVEYEGDWKKEQWKFFKHVDVEEILPLAYELYLAQQSVKLWTGGSPPHVAVALCLWACIASAERYLSDFTHISRELIAIFGLSYHGVSERSLEMKNLIVSFSNSFEAAGAPRAHLSAPRSGPLGDGFHGYNSDGRRRIPELEMAGGSARTVALYWREIVWTRKHYGYHIQSIAHECDKARPIFAALGEQVGRRSRQRYTGRSSFTPVLKPSSFTQLPKPVQIAKTAQLSKTVQSMTAATLSAAPIAVDYNNDSFHPQPDFVPPPDPKTIEELLAMDDKSSVDESVQSSQDGDLAYEPAKATSFSRALAAINDQSDHSYSIKHHFLPSGTGAQISSASPPWHSASDISPSPVLMTRQESGISTARSDRASVSSAEHMIGSSVSIGLGVTGISQHNSTPSISNSRVGTTIHALSSAASDTFDDAQEGFFIADEALIGQDVENLTLADLQAAGEYNPIHIGLLENERVYYVTYRSPRRRHKNKPLPVDPNQQTSAGHGVKRPRTPETGLVNIEENNAKSNQRKVKRTVDNQAVPLPKASTNIIGSSASTKTTQQPHIQQQPVRAIKKPPGNYANHTRATGTASRINHGALQQALAATGTCFKTPTTPTPPGPPGQKRNSPLSAPKRINYAALERALAISEGLSVADPTMNDPLNTIPPSQQAAPTAVPSTQLSVKAAEATEPDRSITQPTLSHHQRISAKLQ